MSKTYLGNGVYASHEDDAILLTTEDEEEVYNQVFLDQSTLAAFLEFARNEKRGSWTTQPPTEPGWYWFENGNAEIQAVQVVKIHRSAFESDLYAHITGFSLALAEVEGTWFSEPLTVPGNNNKE